MKTISSLCLLFFGAAACAAGSANAEQAQKTLTGVYYFPGWYRTGGTVPKSPYDRGSDFSEWRGCIAKAATPRPLCGFYDDSDPRLWDYYVRWMTSHGIDFISFDWYYNDGADYIYESLDRGFLHAERNTEIQFCIHWCNHGGYWWHKPLNQSKDALVNMVDIMSARYFHRPNYLKIDDKPVLMIYDIDTLLGFGGVEGVRSGIEAMRERARKNGHKGLYMVVVYSGTNGDYIRMLENLGFDAFCAYTYAWMRAPRVRWDSKVVPYNELSEYVSGSVYPHLARVSKSKGIAYWPTTFSGWDDRPRAGLENGIVLIDNTPEHFGKLFSNALKHVNPVSPVVMVEAWNEWGEGANIEPSKEHGFGYLQEIAKALGITETDQRLPSDEEIRSWSILDDDELAEARENESKPWPTKEVIRYNVGESFDVPDVKMPVVFDFSDGGVELDDLVITQMDLMERTSEGMLLETTGGDPGVVLTNLRIPTRQVKRIIIEMDILDREPGYWAPGFEVFWTTGLMPEFSPFCSSALPVGKDGRIELRTDEMMEWVETGTPLTSLRVDTGYSAGIGLKLKRVILED